jgi:hypothetical protein
MPNEGYFMAMGGLGVSLAGFAGLITAFDRTAIAGSPVAVYRISGIVFLSFAVTFAGFGIIVAYEATGHDLPLTIRIGTILLALPYVRGFLQARPGPSWPDERQRWTTIASLVVLTLATLANVVFASLGYLEVLVMAGLLGPITIFYNTIRDYTRAAPTASEPEPAPESEPPGSATLPT